MTLLGTALFSLVSLFLFYIAFLLLQPLAKRKPATHALRNIIRYTLLGVVLAALSISPLSYISIPRRTLYIINMTLLFFLFVIIPITSAFLATSPKNLSDQS